MLLLALAAAASNVIARQQQYPLGDLITQCYNDRACTAHRMAQQDVTNIAPDYCKDMGPPPENLTLEQKTDLMDFCYIYWRGWWDNRKQELDK